MKIGFVGCGHVGSASAYACVMRGVGTELVLIDYNEELAKAQAEDILHATPFAYPVQIRAGQYEDLTGAGIVMISAGVGQKPGETRLDLLKRNADVFASIIPQILKNAPNAILLIATNPVDVMTHIAAAIAKDSHNHERHKVIGSGTILDTARFRALIAGHLGISPHSVHAYVLGEHGDSELLQWSGANVGNMPLENFAAQINAPITEDIKTKIDEGVRRAAYRIIQGKGATWYGIGAGMARIAQAITDDEGAVMTCSSLTPDIEGIENVSLSLPRIVSASGMSDTLYPVFSTDEKIKIKKSAEILRDAIASIGF